MGIVAPSREKLLFPGGLHSIPGVLELGPGVYQLCDLGLVSIMLTLNFLVYKMGIWMLLLLASHGHYKDQI